MTCSILPNDAERGGRIGKWDERENLCVFCVGKAKPAVLNSQVNIGQSQSERKEIHKSFVLSFVCEI